MAAATAKRGDAVERVQRSTEKENDLARFRVEVVLSRP
jgi:hypothetical protein